MKSLLRTPLKLNLQYFAEEGDAGNAAGANGSDNSNANEPNNDNGDKGNEDGDGNEDKKYTRSDVRKMFASQMNDFKNNELPGLLDKARSEGERRAKMSDKERNANDMKEREDELNKREAALNQRDALNDTKTRLSNDGLPTDFATMLSDLNEDKRAENIANFKKMYNSSVHNGVLEATKGKKTPNAGTNDNRTQNSGSKFAEMANKQDQESPKDPWARK
ncbi:Lj965 prophage scaffold protein [Companilactobacillus farciminis]|nr:Lj965 prophage scaffold protein [Companilactobacillus farciminis]